MRYFFGILIGILLAFGFVAYGATTVPVGKNGTSEYLLYPADKFGVGTSTPYSKLTIWGGSTGNILEAVTNASSTAFLVTAAGNVGIGETAPGSKLSVSGGATIGASFDTATSPTNGLLVEGNLGVGSSTVSSRIHFHQAAQSNVGGIRLTRSNTLGTFANWISPTDGLTWSYASDNSTFTDLLTLTSGGNVGIGTTTPSTHAVPSGFTTANGRLLEINSQTTTGDAGIMLTRSDSAAGLHLWTDNSSGDVFIDNMRNSSSADLLFRTTSSGTAGTNLTLMGNDNNAFGTTTSYARLTVWGGGTGTGGQTFEVANNASTTLMRINDIGTAYMLGSVGIATTTPGALLSVHGNALVSGSLTVAGITATSTVSLGERLNFNTVTATHDTATDNISSRSTGRLDLTARGSLYLYLDSNNNGSADTFSIFRNGATDEILTLVEGTGFLGLGTTSPSSLLSVQGNSTFTGTLNVAGITATSTIDFSTATVKQKQYPAFTYATSSAWTATTTIFLGPAGVNETWNKVWCETDAGTVNVSFYDGTNRMNLVNASTTVGTTTLSTNNSFGAVESRRVDIGTPASSPTRIACTVEKTINL